MFDKKRPYNELPKLPPNFNFDDVEILKLVNKANMALSGFNGAANVLPNRTVIVAPLAVKEAVASSGVENINTTAEEVFKAELFPETEETDAQKETRRYKNILLDGWRIVGKKGFLNTNDYVSLQEKLEPGKSGVRRKDQTTEPVRIQNSKTGEVIYTPPEGHDLICELLKNYEDYYNDTADDGIDALIKLAVLHYQFEAIHPFRDGNGRTGRMLMVLYLVLRDRLDLPILFISGYILKHRDEYYKRLQAVTEKSEWKEWVVYILSAVIEQAKESHKTVEAIKEQIWAYKKKATMEDLPNDSNVVDYLFSKPIYTYSDMARRAGIHYNTAYTYLNKLHKANVLEKGRHKKEIVFYNPNFISLL